MRGPLRLNLPRQAAAAVTAAVLFGPVAYGEGLVVKIELPQHSAKPGSDFPVLTTVRNVGPAERSLRVWSCSYARQWISDAPRVQIYGGSCKKNDLVRISLKPGESYERKLSLRFGGPSDADGRGPLSFRLGFQPIAPDHVEGSAPIWSERLTVQLAD